MFPFVTYYVTNGRDLDPEEKPKCLLQREGEDHSDDDHDGREQAFPVPGKKECHLEFHAEEILTTGTG